jgi:predicted alpha/beta-hydrolase family hydrolase
VKVAMSAAAGELGRKAEVLERAVAAAGEVVRLEDALNHNLNALAGAKHFEQTVLSLAAAVNMLSARLAETPIAAAPIKLESSRRSIHAA